MTRAFAIVPAAGRGFRMGQPKLLMPLEGRPLIGHAIDAWQQVGVDRIVVVVRADDAPLAAAVTSFQVANIDLVRPVAPPDMKASIQAGLRHIADRLLPTKDDCFLVAPADMPRLSPGIIRALIAEYIQTPGQIVVPVVAGRRGHPVVFPWTLAAKVHGLLPNEGLNALVELHAATELACDRLVADCKEPFTDIDTPEEYRRLAGE
jgi:molybdenum cofactor cytidylyltransferase